MSQRSDYSLTASMLVLRQPLATGLGIVTIATGGGWRSSLDRPRIATITEAVMAANEKAADPVGIWKCEYEIGGQQRTSTLKIEKDGDKLEGTTSWPDQQEAKLKDLKLQDGTLTFSAVRVFREDEIPIDYTLKIDGDQIKGKGESDFGGEKQGWDIEGKRDKK